VSVGAQAAVVDRERRSPGLEALFGALAEDGRHSILDLGPASGTHLRLLGRFASQVRFASLLAATEEAPAWDGSEHALPANPTRPYDVVLAWDVLDRLEADRRPVLIARLAAVTGPQARLFAVTSAEGIAGSAVLAFTLLDRDRVAERPIGVTKSPGGPLLPAQMERVLAPFEVVSAFILRTGAREYVAMKRK
jgi:hypothetical protein